MKSRKKKTLPTRAKRYKSKLSKNLEYLNLEPRRLLASDFLSAINFQEGGSELVNLTSPVPVSESVELLRSQLNLQAKESLKLQKVTTDQIGFQHFKYQQYFDGIKVEGGNYTLHVKDSEVVLMSGELIEVQNPVTGPLIPSEAALQNAMDYIGATQFVWQADSPLTPLGSTDVPDGELVYLTNIDGQSVPAFKFDIVATAPVVSGTDIYVNAITGEVEIAIDQQRDADVAADGETLYNGIQDFTADSFDFGGNPNNPKFRLRREQRINPPDPDNQTAIITLDNLSFPVGFSLFAEDITSESTNFDNFTNAAHVAGVSAHWGAEQTIEYYLTKYGRNSYDNNGAPIISFVNSGTNMVNATWFLDVMWYGQGDGIDFSPLVSLDVVGHELTHGVIDNSADLVYQDEPGALNESFSDIFGEAIENYAQNGHNDWLLGADFHVDGTSAFRSFSVPNLYNQADTYLGDFWFTGPGDNGGVHFNSGVQNHWFYLLSEGGTGTNDNGDDYTVVGIGIDDAAAIAYRNLTVYLGVNSQYQDARDGSVQAAIDLFGKDSPQHIQTSRAWRAVGVYGPAVEILDAEPITEGTLIYQGSGFGVVEPDDTRIVLTELDAGQTFSVVVTAQKDLIPVIQALGPNGTILGNATATGDTVRLENLPVLESGIYRILVSGVDRSFGDFDVQLFLNTSLEAESFGDGSDDTQAEAQAIGDAVFDLHIPGFLDVDRIAVIGQLGVEEADVVFADGFESGELDGAWTTYSSDSFSGQIRVSDRFGSAEGDYALFMDTRLNGALNLNEAIWSVDLSGVPTPVLTFFHSEYDDENATLPVSFANSFNGDGVSVSDDGVIWHTILTDSETPSGEWNRFSINLLDFTQSVGIDLNAQFQIKFQQYDDGLLGFDGRGFDGIEIKSTSATTSDWYSFELEAGQIATISATKYNGSGDIDLELYDSAGNLLRTGSDTPNVSSNISQFVAGSTDSYFAKITGQGGGTKYSLLVTRGADFDTGSSTVSVQDISLPTTVLGAVGSITQQIGDPDFAATQTIINNFFNGVVLSNNVTGGDVYAVQSPFKAPTGANVFAPGPLDAAGWREGVNELRADFAINQFEVTIDAGSDDGDEDVSFLRAYDVNGVLLDEATSRSLATGERQTLRVRNIDGDIAYIIASGIGNDVAPLDNLHYQVDAITSDYYSFELIDGTDMKIEARLPGAAPLLFDNDLFTPGNIKIRMELSDDQGNIIATGKNAISLIVNGTGLYQLRVFSVGGNGDYILNIGEKPENYIDIGPLGKGIAVADDATGQGFVLFSVESVHSRFAQDAPNVDNADHLIAVRYNEGTGTWEYNDDNNWQPFESLLSDRILAIVDFDADSVRSLLSEYGSHRGIMYGVADSDLDFFANVWDGLPDDGEFGVVGSYIYLEEEIGGPLGDLNRGIGVTDNATGIGYLMYSRESVHTRFSSDAPNSFNSDRLIAVRYNGGSSNWEYNNNLGWFAFTPTATDRLLAEVNFTADTLVSLQGNIGTINGIGSGYTLGDLVFKVNRWNGQGNSGEFEVKGTAFFVTDVNYEAGDLQRGIGVDDNATGTGFLLYSVESVHTRFAANAPNVNNANQFIAVRYDSIFKVWEYNDNFVWFTFSLAEGDRLMATMDFDADTIDSLSGIDSTFQGVDMGYLAGDLSFAANRWNGQGNTGEFEVYGTFFTA